MSQHDYNIANGGGAAVRADLNNALAAVLSQNSGATAPTTTKPFMLWYDTANGIIKLRNSADTAWLDYMNSSGQLIAPTATGLITALGGQIKFPTSQNASADANTLDDYEEGTFTPSFANLTVGNGTVVGKYTKFGNVVNLSIVLQFGSTSAWTGTCSGVGGLPFTAFTSAASGFYPFVGQAYKSGVGWWGYTAGILSNTAGFSYPVSASANQTISSTTPFTWANTDSFQLNGTYLTS